MLIFLRMRVEGRIITLHPPPTSKFGLKTKIYCQTLEQCILFPKLIIGKLKVDRSFTKTFKKYYHTPKLFNSSTAVIRPGNCGGSWDPRSK